jgi:translocation and assembly module TamB
MIRRKLRLHVSKLRILLWMGLLLFSVFAYLMYSNTGVRLAVYFLQKQMSGQLQIAHADGSLGNTIELRDVRYQDDDISLHADHVLFTWRPLSLLTKTLAFPFVGVDKLSIDFLQNSQSEFSWEDLRLPWQIKVKRGVVYQTKLAFVDDTYLLLENMKLRTQSMRPGTRAIVRWQQIQLNTPEDSVVISQAGKAHLDLWQDKLALNLEDVSLLTGQVQVSAELSLLAPFSWQVDMQSRALNPGLIWPDSDGNINFRLQSTGQLHGRELTTNTLLDEVSGQLLGKNLSGYAKLNKQTGTQWEINTDLQLGDAVIRAEGGSDQRYFYQWHVDIPRTTPLLPGSQGQVYLHGSLYDDGGHRVLNSQTEIIDFAFRGLSVGKLSSKLIAQLRPKNVINFTVHGQQLAYQNTGVEDLQLSLIGTPAEHEVDLAINSTQGKVNLHAFAAWHAQNWLATLSQLHIQPQAKSAWHLPQPTTLTWSPQHAELKKLCLLSMQKHLCANLAFNQQQQWHGHITGKNFPLADLQAFFPEYAKITNLIDFNLEFTTDNTQKLTAQAEAKLSAGEISYPLLDQLQVVQLDDSYFNIQIDQQGVVLEGDLQLLSGEQIHSAVRLPEYRQLRALRDDEPIQGEFNVDSQRLSSLSVLFPYLHETKGQLQGEFRLAGNLQAPKYQGQITLRNASAKIPELALELQDIHATIDAHDNDTFQVDIGLRSGGGELAIQGTLALTAQALKTDFHVTGEQFLVMNTPEYFIRVSPNLALSGVNDRLLINGEIILPEAKIVPINFENSVLVADDIVMVRNGKRIEEVAGYNLESEIHLILGDKVNLDYRGIQVRIGGELMITDRLDSLATAVGELSVYEGKYAAYGQELSLERGRLLFTGGPVTNPGIDVRAVKTIQTNSEDLASRNFSLEGSSLAFTQQTELTLGVNVQNTLKQPRITFFSQPGGLSQSDILSYLLTGGPASQVDQLNQQGLISAISALNIGGSDKLMTNQLKSAFGLSDIRIRTHSKEDLQQLDSADANDPFKSTSLLLGKFLTPKLYVSYDLGFIDELRVFRAQYFLTRNITLQGETNMRGENSGGRQGVDLFYTFEK